MESDELPWEFLKSVGRDSIRQMQVTRFYLQQKRDPHGSSVALFVGNLPSNLSQRQYENVFTELLGHGELNFFLIKSTNFLYFNLLTLLI